MTFFTEYAKIQFLYSREYSKYRDKILLLEPFNYVPITEYFEREILPEGFVTDNASIPDFLAWFIHPNDKRLRAAAWHHDYVPQQKKYYIDKYGYSDEELFLKNNLEFVSMARKHGFPEWKCKLMFFAINNTKIAKDIWARGGQLKDN